MDVACGHVWACGHVGMWTWHVDVACGHVHVDVACGRVGVWACGRVGMNEMNRIKNGAEVEAEICKRI